MPETEDIILRINGVEWKGWKSIEISLQMDAIAGTFSLGLADRWSQDMAYPPIAAGMECEVLCGGVKFITGYIDRRKRRKTTTDHGITVNGRDRSGDLVDCSAVHKPGHWRGLTALELATILAEPFGVPVTAYGDVGEPFESFKLEQGETAHEALDRILKQRELLALPDGGGGLTLIKLGALTCEVELLEGEGGNVIEVEDDYDMQERFSHYLLQGQQPGNDEVFGEEASAVSGNGRDPSVPRYRPKILRAKTQVNPSSAQKEADWEATVRAARAVTVTVTVRGWREKPGGACWCVNSMVQAKIPSMDLDQEMIIGKASFSKGSQGTLTRLELKDPRSFLPEPQKPKGGGGGAGGKSGNYTIADELQLASGQQAAAAHDNIKGNAP